MMSAVAETPARAAFLCTSTAEFHPPEWATAPVEANAHARLEAFRDSRHCATYVIATQRVNVFGRDQESCDHVLGNPSVSRKHAAVIHDNAGGIYLVDLMSRHGTFVGRKKLPPHDPFLLHEGDIVKFGQSIRVYILKGASPDGNSAPVKKSWGRVKLRAPRIGSVLPKMPSRPHVSAPVTKIVNEVCYGTMSDEKLETFLSAALELSSEEKKELADFLVEKIQAKYEFYAAQVHRNAYAATTALLRQNLCVEEFESNLATITHLSQSRHDSIYRADARKILQLMAAVRLDPDNIQFNDTESVVSNEDEAAACPPTANNRGGRERVLSDEGKKLFLAGHADSRATIESSQTGSDSGWSHRETIGHIDGQYRTNGYASSQYGSEYEGNGGSSVDNGYEPPLNVHNGNGYGQPRKYVQSASTISDPASARSQDGVKGGGTFDGISAQRSAFGFIATEDAEDDASSHTSSTDRPSTGFNFLQKRAEPTPPSVDAADFLADEPSVDESEFEDKWESTNEAEEWSVDIGALDAHELDDFGLQAYLESFRIACVSSEKVGGQLRWRLLAEQKANGTVFMAELLVMPGLSDMTVTLKWIVNSLIYENGHLIFMEILKYSLHDFIRQVESQMDSQPAPTRQASEPSPRKPTTHEQHPAAQPSARSGEATGKKPQPRVTTTSKDETEEEDDAMDARDYLTPNPAIDASKFEQIWASASAIASLSYPLADIPEKEEVIELFGRNFLSCLASGNVDHLYKFFFYGEMTELQVIFCLEIVLDMQKGAIEGTVKRLDFQVRSEEDEEQIDSSFVAFVEEVLREL